MKMLAHIDIRGWGVTSPRKHKKPDLEQSKLVFKKAEERLDFSQLNEARTG